MGRQFITGFVYYKGLAGSAACGLLGVVSKVDVFEVLLRPSEPGGCAS
jgi:hypothetical protein